MIMNARFRSTYCIESFQMFNPCVVFLLNAPTSSEKPNMQNGSCFRAVRRRHFLKRPYRYLQLWLAMLCSYVAGSHRESNQMLLASAYASCLPSCVHMQLFSHLPRIASPPSRGLLLHLHIPFRPGQPCKAVAAIGAVLAPSGRQQFSLFFRTAYYFFEKRTKKWTQFGCQIPAPKWVQFPDPEYKMH